MNTPALGGLPASMPRAPHRFSVEDYHKMISTGILREGDPVELIDGIVVQKMAQNPPHRAAVRRAARRIEALASPGWQVWSQAPVTLSTSEPEPDVVVAQGNEATYAARHPGPADIGLLVEVADSTLLSDRQDKGGLYAQDNIVEYWIVNIPDCQVEVYTQPSGPTAAPAYAQRQTYPAGSSVPLVLGGVTLGTIPVDELLP